MNEQLQNQNTFELGSLVGRHEALGLIASRCFAADAATLRTIRDKELWRGVTSSWSQFCENRLRMSRSNANRLIRLLEEFGPAYFQITHAARISAEEYRNTIAPAVHDQRLHVNGEAIALTEENDPRISAAVNELRQAITVKAIEGPAENAGCESEGAPGIRRAFQLLERHCGELVAEFTTAAGECCAAPGDYSELESIVLRFQLRLSKFETEIETERRDKLGSTDLTQQDVRR